MKQLPKFNFEWSLPNMVTLMNLFSGFFSLLMASHHHFMAAGWLIALAFIFDSLDGNIAHAFNDASDFGKELDSLSDMVSFAAAPAFFAWSLLDVLSRSMALPFLFFFIACGALRLARFNISSARRSCFEGLPTPAAALTTVMFGLASLKNSWTEQPLFQFFFCGFIAFAGLLMVSTVNYPKFSAIPFKKWRHFLLGALAAAIAVSYFTNIETAFFVILASFISISPFCIGALELRPEPLPSEETH